VPILSSPSTTAIPHPNFTCKFLLSFFSLWKFTVPLALHFKFPLALGKASAYQEKANDEKYPWQGREPFRDGKHNGGQADKVMIEVEF